MSADSQRIPWCGIAVFAVVVTPLMVFLIRSSLYWLGWATCLFCWGPILVPALFFGGEAAVKGFLTRAAIKAGKVVRCPNCGNPLTPESVAADTNCVYCLHSLEDLKRQLGKDT